MALAGLIPPEFRARGLTPGELERAQEAAGAQFPQDLCELLSSCLPAGPLFPDWRREPAASMDRWRQVLLDGILFDVDNGIWCDDWGERPPDAAAAKELASGLLDRAPDLIPIYGHRGIANQPLERGNPVFSVVQTDAIVYGLDLKDYLRNEFHRQALRVAGTAREISFWTPLTRC